MISLPFLGTTLGGQEEDLMRTSFLAMGTETHAHNYPITLCLEGLPG